MGEVNGNTRERSLVRALLGRMSRGLRRSPQVVWIGTKARVVLLWRKTGTACRVMAAWRFGRVLFWASVACIVLMAAVVAGLFVTERYLASTVPQNPPVDNIYYLDQGWGTAVSSKDRQLYYYTPQGTSFVNLRYSWFVSIEAADSRELFIAPEHMRAMGFIVDKKTPENPYQLPVGFTKHFDTTLKEEFLDITCAACHTGELHVISKDGERVAIRIDGGQAMHAFTSASPGQFGPSLTSAMIATYLNPWKFNRFAHKVLGEQYNAGYWHLRGEFQSMLLSALTTAFSDKVHGKYPVDEGYGRTDAIARISNKVFGEQLDSANYVVGDAPVSYPSIWYAPKYDWVQYTGSVSQPLARNLGESLGVGARVDLMDAYGRPVPSNRRFTSESLIENLTKIEATIEKLEAPRWPDQILGAPDHDKLVAGRKLYEKHCQHCHEPCLENPYDAAVNMPLRSSPNPLWHLNLIPIEEVGTDPQAALNFANGRINLKKTGLSSGEVAALLEQELREREIRKQLFSSLKDDFKSWDGKNPDEKTFLERADGKRRTLIEKKSNVPLSKDAEASIQRALDAINVESTTIGQALNYVGFFLRDRYYTALGLDAEEQQTANGWGALDLPQVLKVYKAKPLGGVWATAPYLHNGSVPTLYEMLLPAERRSKKFFISRMDFDPVSVGLMKDPSTDKGFWFDTSIPGNLNIGHEFRAGYGGFQDPSSPSPGVIGPELTDAERWQLVEYLKVHQEEPKLCDVKEGTY